MRSAGRRALAIAAGAAVALAAAEAALRATGAGAYAPRQDTYNLVVRAGDVGYLVFDPSKPMRHVWDGDPYGNLPPGAAMTYEIGSARLRGEPPHAGRPAALVLGDSFTFGEGVRLEDTFVARLERAFAVGAPSAAAAPAFVNAGVPGYGTQEQAMRLPSLLDRFSPRAVLLVFVPNDPIPIHETAGVADLVNAKTRDDAPLRVLALARDVLGRGSANRAVEEWYLSYYVGERRARWDDARRRLAEMRDLCRARGAAFGVALFPILHRLADRPLAPIHDAVRAECAALGVPFLDLTDALAVEPDRALWVHPTDHHPDARAHELAAAALVPFVASFAGPSLGKDR